MGAGRLSPLAPLTLTTGLPTHVGLITADSVDRFKNRLDKFWANEEALFYWLPLTELNHTHTDQSRRGRIKVTYLMLHSRGLLSHWPFVGEPLVSDERHLPLHHRQQTNR